MRALALVSDAFGSSGGIARYNGHLLTALCGVPACTGVEVLPRLAPDYRGTLPANLHWRREAAGGKLRYLLVAARIAIGGGRYDLVFCGHLNLLPLAWLLSRRFGARLVVQLHGLEAWQPPGQASPYLDGARVGSGWSAPFVRRAARTALWLSVSRITRARFMAWSNAPPERTRVLPNTLPSALAAAPKDAGLAARHGLHGKKVLLTLGRLDPREHFKGFDATLDALPLVLSEIPDLVYVIAGDGAGRRRLEEKARRLGVWDHVRFLGMIPDSQKAGVYALADVFSMPSKQEGFGIVILEALACGVPVVGSAADGTRDPLQDARNGILVNPDDPRSVADGLLQALRSPERPPHPGAFAYERFAAHLQALCSQWLRADPAPSGA